MIAPFQQRPPGNWNWGALSEFPDLLVRRSAANDQGRSQAGPTAEWTILSRPVPEPAFPVPQDDGTWAGHLNFDHPDVVDHEPRKAPRTGWSRSRWWKPSLVLSGGSEGFHTEWDEHGAGKAVIAELSHPPGARQADLRPVTWTRQTSKERYLGSVDKLLGHIQRGDIYEINYCTERTALLPALDPFTAFGQLLAHTDAPFAALYRHGHLFALCMSPEHFLRVENKVITTRPMKGTRRRSNDQHLDRSLVEELATDAKERSENIMAVDVARHDLSRVAASGSVRVEELCAVKTYPNVHQLVSTVRGVLRDGLHPWDAVRASFPMASMTGAPKRSALRLIDAAEDMPRGLFSGGLGFQLPGGVIDLNVAIRTITYDASTGQASLITGSAITALSDPEKEWEECELKAMSILQALGHAG